MESAHMGPDAILSTTQLSKVVVLNTFYARASATPVCPSEEPLLHHQVSRIRLPSPELHQYPLLPVIQFSLLLLLRPEAMCLPSKEWSPVPVVAHADAPELEILFRTLSPTINSYVHLLPVP